MPPEKVGQVIGRYRVDAFIGEGGMGRVYRGFDPTLGRVVAIKLLPQNVSRDPDRMERFVREARTASALNHPNVVTIYEIGSADSQQYIAMELLEGETLRDRLTHGRLDLRRAIDIAAQIADGVAAAHAAGVIHRDLKPENIVLTKSGFVKILDFGLAKLREAPVSADDGATARRTDPGTVLGSAGYMSPEQATARDVDHRSDIFSIGCIVYELVTGRRAFAGDSSIDTLHKILHDDPRPLRELTPDVPFELQRIVRKALSKDPDERYQSAKDLAIDLRALRREIDSQPKGVVPGGVEKPKKRSPITLGALVVVVVVMASAAAYVLTHRVPPPPVKAMSVSRLTASGNVIGAVISPNGEYLAYAYSDAGKHSLFLKQVATGSSLQLVAPAPVGMWGITFSPDSRSVFYAMKAFNDPGGSLYAVPILGGESRRLLDGIDSAVTFSPDGKRIAFTRLNEPSPGHSAIVVANADGSGEKDLSVKATPQAFAPIFWGAPAWSPDGRWIAAALSLGGEATLVGISVADGTEKRLTSDRWAFVGHVAWLRDMKGLIVVARDEAAGNAVGGGADPQLWKISYPGGGRRQVTNDLFAYRMVSLSGDDEQLVTVAADQTSSTWLTPLAAGAKPVKLTSGKYDGLMGIAATADGVVIATRDNDRSSLVEVGGEGTSRRIISPPDMVAMAPAVSPDGRRIVFTTPRQNDWALMRMDRDGRNLITLCGFVPAGTPPGRPAVTPDGNSVLFEAAPDGNQHIYKVSINGGTPAVVPVEGGFTVALSPDQTRVAYISTKEYWIEIAAVTGGPPIRWFRDVSPNNYSMVRWTTDGQAILHNAAANDRKNVWLQPIDGSPPHPVTSFDDQYILGFDVVPGGRALVVVRGILSRDALLIRNFQ